VEDLLDKIMPLGGKSSREDDSQLLQQDECPFGFDFQDNEP